MIRLDSDTKHILHCVLFITVIILFEIQSGGVKLWYNDDDIVIDATTKYGPVKAGFLYFLRILALLSLPQCICNFLGLTLYNAFNEKVTLKSTPLLAPFICIRTVTRGDYPDLINRNVMRNIQTCLSVGLENFIVEVVTDKPLSLPKHPRIREVVVPKEYKTKTGALFKVILLSFFVFYILYLLFCSFRQEHCNSVLKIIITFWVTTTGWCIWTRRPS